MLGALVVRQVAVASRGPSELGATLGAVRFGGGTGFLALMAEQVAKRGELPAVAAVFPALRLGPLVEHADRRVAAHGLGEHFVDAAADERRRVAHAVRRGVDLRGAWRGGECLAVHVLVVEIG